MHGQPLNFMLPVKDSTGNDIKLGSLQLGMHTSAMTNGRPSLANGVAGSPSSTALLTAVPEVNATVNNSFNYLRNNSNNQRTYMLLEYLEGNISQDAADPHNNSPAPSDMFFEAGLLLNEDIKGLLDNSQDSNSSSYISRSGILFGHAIDHWPLTSRILLPPDLAIYLQRIKAIDSLSLAITVKSSTLSSFPEQGRARVSVPNTVFKQTGRKFEQWISFYNSSNDNTNNNNKFAGRVRLRVSMVVEDMSNYPPPLGPQQQQTETMATVGAAGSSSSSSSSIGRVSMRLIGVHSSRNEADKYSERVLLAQAMSTLSSSNDGGYDDSNNSNGNAVIDRTSLQMESFYNSSDYSNSSPPLSAMSLLTGNVSIPCGSTDISIDLKTETAITAFTVSFPAARALPKLPAIVNNNNSSMMTVPELVLPMTKKRNLKQQLMITSLIQDDPDSALTINRLDSSLKLQVCFVPYLEGTLMVRVHGLKGGSYHRAGRDDNDPLSARLSMGYPAPSAFDHIYPVPLTIITATDGSSASTSGGGSSMCRLKLSTFELLQQEGGDNINSIINDRERRGLLPLVIHLFESFPLQDTALGMVQEHSPVLIGQVFTAPVYMLALRRLVSTKVRANSSSGIDGSDDQELLWLPLLADLFPVNSNGNSNGSRQPQQRLQLALSLSFKIDAIPKAVASPLTALIFNTDFLSANDNISSGEEEEEDRPAAMARVELGLKQAFLLADTDNSGSISSDELLAAIKKADSQKINQEKTATASSNTMTMTASKGGGNKNKLSPPLPPPPIGLENTAQLLMTLAGPIADINNNNNNNHNNMTSTSGSPSRRAVLFEDDDLLNQQQQLSPDQILEAEVKEIFRRLDIDGDGSISWLEWKSVLTISLYKQQRLKRLQQLQQANDNRQMMRLDPLDPLLVTFFAALDIAKPSNNLSRYPEEINPAALHNINSGNQYNIDAFRDLQKQYGLDSSNLNRETIEDNNSNNSLLATQSDRSKVSARLQMMVQSLRTTNSLLSQRLEEALSASQQMGNTAQSMIDIDMASTNNSNNNNRLAFSPLAASLNLKEQQLHSDHLDRLDQQSEQYALALAAANQRSDMLSSQLAGYRSASATQQSDRGRQDQHDSEDMQHITAFIAQRLEGIEQAKIEKKHRMQAMVILKLYLRFRALPKIRKKLRSEAKVMITRNLTAMIATKWRSKHSQKIRSAIVSIQRVMKGCLCRRAQKKKQQAATALQRTYRGGLARNQAKQIKAERAAVILQKKNKAANVIADRYREHRMWKRARAIAIIHKYAANYHCRKLAKKEVNERKEAKRQFERLVKAARHIQVYARLWQLRRLAKAETARRKARRDFYKDIKKLHLWPQKPDIRSVNGFWIAELTFLLQQASQSAELKLPEHIFSMIESSDPANRILHVKYIPKEEDPAITPSFEKKVVAYDHPQLNWYSSTHPPLPVTTTINTVGYGSSPSNKQGSSPSYHLHQHHHSPHHQSHLSQGQQMMSTPQPIIEETQTDGNDHDDDLEKTVKDDGDQDNKDDADIGEEELHVIQSGDELMFSSRNVDLAQFFDDNHNDTGLVPLPWDCTRGGYQVSFSTDGGEMQSKLGAVTTYDALNNLIGIDFDRSASSTKASSRLTWLRYDHPYLSWFNRDGGLLTKRKDGGNNGHNNYHPGVLGSVPIIGSASGSIGGVGTSVSVHHSSSPVKRSATPAKH